MEDPESSQRLQSCIDRWMAVLHDTTRPCPPCEQTIPCSYYQRGSACKRAAPSDPFSRLVSLHSPSSGISISISSASKFVAVGPDSGELEGYCRYGVAAMGRGDVVSPASRDSYYRLWKHSRGGSRRMALALALLEPSVGEVCKRGCLRRPLAIQIVGTAPSQPLSYSDWVQAT